MLSRIAIRTSQAQRSLISTSLRRLALGQPPFVQLLNCTCHRRCQSTTSASPADKDTKAVAGELGKDVAKISSIAFSPTKPANLQSQPGQIAWQTTDEQGEAIRQSPWLKPLRSDKHYRDDAFGRLQQELLSYAKYIKQSHQEKHARFVTGQYLKDKFARAPGLDRHVHISPLVDFAVPHSPLIFFSKINTPHGVNEVFDQRRTFIRNLRLQAIENALFALNTSNDAKDDIFVRDEAVLHVPDSHCLFLRHVPTGMRIIIWADRWTNEAVRSAAIKRYTERYPFFETVYIAMRMLLETRGLFDDGYTTPLTADGQPGRRNVDPYTLMLLIVGALRQSKPEGTYMKFDFSSPFLDVLNFLSTWDMKNYGMTVNNPKMFRFGDKKDPFRPGAPGQLPFQKPPAVPQGQRRICVQDVIDEWRDIGSQITTAGEFQDLCRATFLDVSSQMEKWENQKEIYGEDGKLAERPVLLRALAANYKSLKAWRAHLVKGSHPIEDKLWGNEPSRSNWRQNVPPVDWRNKKRVERKSVKKGPATSAVHDDLAKSDDLVDSRRAQKPAAEIMRGQDIRGFNKPSPFNWRQNASSVSGDGAGQFQGGFVKARQKES